MRGTKNMYVQQYQKPKTIRKNCTDSFSFKCSHYSTYQNG